jgi:hypothetical protein
VQLSRNITKLKRNLRVTFFFHLAAVTMQVTVTSADGAQVVQISAEPSQQLSSVGPQLQQQVGCLKGLLCCIYCL